MALIGQDTSKSGRSLKTPHSPMGDRPLKRLAATPQKLKSLAATRVPAANDALTNPSLLCWLPLTFQEFAILSNSRPSDLTYTCEV